MLDHVPTRDEIDAFSPAQRIAMLKAAIPRIVQPYFPHAPHAPQALFLLDNRREAFYGGAAGGGKSDALLMSALQYVDVPHYSALIIRRSYADLAMAGAIMERAESWLGATQARKKDGGKFWLFPTGEDPRDLTGAARLSFGYVRYPRDV